MSKRVIHVSEAEAANDFLSLLARVRASAEVVIDEESAEPCQLPFPIPIYESNCVEAITWELGHVGVVCRIVQHPSLKMRFAGIER